MKTAIIVHSFSGNTLSAAEMLHGALLAKGHSADVLRVSALNEDVNAPPSSIKLQDAPDPTSYDAIFVGAPVRAFSISPVMLEYLKNIPDLPGIKVGCFTTQHLKLPSLGGNRALRQMKAALEAKGANVFECLPINWTSKKRPAQIAELLEKMTSL
ncbi:MAG: flavodoxin family protein [Christensenellales bacterium]